MICFDFDFFQTTAKFIKSRSADRHYYQAGQIRKNRCETYEIRKLCFSFKYLNVTFSFGSRMAVVFNLFHAVTQFATQFNVTTPVHIFHSSKNAVRFATHFVS